MDLQLDHENRGWGEYSNRIVAALLAAAMVLGAIDFRRHQTMPRQKAALAAAFFRGNTFLNIYPKELNEEAHFEVVLPTNPNIHNTPSRHFRILRGQVRLIPQSGDYDPYQIELKAHRCVDLPRAAKTVATETTTDKGEVGESVTKASIRLCNYSDYPVHPTFTSYDHLPEDRWRGSHQPPLAIQDK